MPDVVEEAKELIDRPDVRLMSLMDHTPGQRQFRDEVKLRDYYRGKAGGMTDAQLDVLFKRRFDYQQAYAANNMRESICPTLGRIEYRRNCPLPGAAATGPRPAPAANTCPPSPGPPAGNNP